MKCENCRFAYKDDEVIDPYYVCLIHSNLSLTRELLTVAANKNERICETNILVRSDFGCVDFRKRIPTL